MGGGSFSYSTAVTRSTSYAGKSTNAIFQSNIDKKINNAMDPYGIKFRESRDSEEHPNSFPIIINLDVTGSMGSIPLWLVKESLPEIMKKIIDAGIPDPQVLFTAIGDHTCDNAPLQVGQFESSDELLDHWLTKVWLESGGGGNDGESYLLAWYFAANHTVHDSLDIRNQKGVCITIGDEKTLQDLSKKNLENIMGPGQYGNVTYHQLLEQAEKKYHCHHIHVLETRAGQDTSTQNQWKQLMGNNLHMVQRKEDIEDLIAKIVISAANKVVTTHVRADSSTEGVEHESSTTVERPENIL
jgi:hypothetical protein